MKIFTKSKHIFSQRKHNSFLTILLTFQYLSSVCFSPIFSQMLVTCYPTCSKHALPCLPPSHCPNLPPLCLPHTAPTCPRSASPSAPLTVRPPPGSSAARDPEQQYHCQASGEIYGNISTILTYFCIYVRVKETHFFYEVNSIDICSNTSVKWERGC